MGALACATQERQMLYDFESDTFERARKSCAEERVNDDVVAVMRARKLLPLCDGLTFDESQGRWLRVRACCKA